jgi:hypothetical protein
MATYTVSSGATSTHITLGYGDNEYVYGTAISTTAYLSGVLIPIRHLINGSTISQTPVGRVSYYHIELARHDVVLAQGLLAEIFWTSRTDRTMRTARVRSGCIRNIRRGCGRRSAAPG